MKNRPPAGRAFQSGWKMKIIPSSPLHHAHRARGYNEKPQVI